MRRQGREVGRDQTERLMRHAGVRGVRKSKRVFMTRPDKAAVLPSDLVNRRFAAPAPRRLWACDATYVATWSGFAYVAFVTDVYSRHIAGVDRYIDAAVGDPADAGAGHGRVERRRTPRRAGPSRGPRVELHGDGLPTGSANSAPSPRQERWVIRLTTRWPRR